MATQKPLRSVTLRPICAPAHSEINSSAHNHMSGPPAAFVYVVCCTCSRALRALLTSAASRADASR